MCPERISSAPASTSAAQHVAAARDRSLARSPGRSGQLVVEEGNAERSGRGGGERRGRPLELSVAQAARLVPPRPDGVEADDAEIIAAVHRLGRLPEAVELGPGPRETGGERVGNVVVARDGNDRWAETAEERGRALVLVAAAAVRQVPGRDDQIRLQAAGQNAERLLDVGGLPGPDVQVGDVQNPRWHGRPTL